MNSISLAATVDSWRHGLWMHCLLRCNTWNNIAVKSRKDSELHDVTFVSEDGLLCPAPKVMLWSQNALPKFIFQNIALPKCPFHPLLHLIVGRKASLRPTSCQLDGEGSSQACIIYGNAGSWIPGTFFPQALLHDLRDFYTILRNFYAILHDFCDFYAIFCQAPKTIMQAWQQLGRKWEWVRFFHQWVKS